MSTQTVYDILRVFTGAGLVRRIEPAGHPARYETRVGDNHHHLVCRSCGLTRDVDCVVAQPPCLVPPDLGDRDVRSFQIDEAEVTFWGLCAACVPSDPAPPPIKEHP